MSELKIDYRYPYVYETHLHTSEGSKCAVSSGAEMARACFEAGYTGIMVTDHFYYGNTAVDRNLSWEDWVHEFCKGYENAKKEGDRLGLQVFFGWEAAYAGTDFLIYGLSPEWLVSHPEIRDASIAEQFQMVHPHGLVIHAHPFRTDFYIPEIRLYPEFVDGVETVNATHVSKYSRNHYNPQFDVEAASYAKEYNLTAVAGSDIHSTELFYGGMGFTHQLESVADYVAAVKTREDYVLMGTVPS